LADGTRLQAKILDTWFKRTGGSGTSCRQTAQVTSAQTRPPEADAHAVEPRTHATADACPVEAIGFFYRDFRQLSDQDVNACLDAPQLTVAADIPVKAK
jgi:hypothetical protein